MRFLYIWGINNKYYYQFEMEERQPNKVSPTRVLIMGNGFDLSIGRRTKYEDFYNSKYCPKEDSAPLITFLNGKWEEEELKNVRWLDLENALQEYAKNQTKSNSQDLGKDKDAFFKIRDGLTKYLLKNGIIAGKDKNNCAINILKMYLNDENSSIYSFNFTRVGNLIDNKRLKILLRDEKIKYIHGSPLVYYPDEDEHIIIGVKDGEYGDYNFMKKTFDENYRSTMLYVDMLHSDEIVIFGHSLGDCDSQYFESFFKGIVNEPASERYRRKNIFIYTYDNDSMMQIKSNLDKLTDYHLSWLYSKCNLEIRTTK